MKYFLFLFSAFFLFGARICSGQADSLAYKDSISAQEDDVPASQLEYRLSQGEFLYYYGTDDTAKALINMFFRKRSFFATRGSSVSAGNACIPIGVVALTDGLGLLFYGVRAAINCTTYNRQKLLYALIDRENGYPLPFQLVSKLKRNDFGL